MGFADLSIREVAEDYQLPLQTVLDLCVQLGIPHQDGESLLALEDVKRVILATRPSAPQTLGDRP